MSLGELYAKATNKQPIRDFVLDESLAGRAAKYRQFAVIGEDPRQTVKDSIHLDWSPLKPHCAECGVTVKMWDSFAHRLLWQQTWPRAVAFQPLSTRYETERSDSPIEGFVFRLWQWQPDVADTFLINKSVSFPKISLLEQQQLVPFLLFAHFLQLEESSSTSSSPSSSPMSTPSSVSSSSKAIQDGEEEEEEDIFALYRKSQDNNLAIDEEEDGGQTYTPPYQVVISNLLPFGRAPNLRGLLSLPEGKSSSKMNSVQRHDSGKEKPQEKLKVVASKWLNVTETIYYATLNHSSPQVIALYRHNLLQECVQRRPNQAYQCHPHYDTMANSSKLHFPTITCLSFDFCSKMFQW